MYVVLKVKVINSKHYSRPKSILVYFKLKKQLCYMKERLLCLQELKFQLCQLKRWHVMKDFQWSPLDAVRDNVTVSKAKKIALTQ